MGKAFLLLVGIILIVVGYFVFRSGFSSIISGGITYLIGLGIICFGIFIVLSSIRGWIAGHGGIDF